MFNVLRLIDVGSKILNAINKFARRAYVLLRV